MITIDTSFISNAKMTDPSVASFCLLGSSRSQFNATGASGAFAVRPDGLVGLPLRERIERPTTALAAGAAEAKAHAYAAVSAETQKQTKQHHMMWAFRGLEPWSDPA